MSYTLFLSHFVLALFAVAAVAVTGWRMFTSMRYAAQHYGIRPFIIFALLMLCVVLALTYASL